ncbi:MAG: RagB/SusD family nutrient uptake outer membrane protein, partial [Sphingobacteriaceae bacterium]
LSLLGQSCKKFLEEDPKGRVTAKYLATEKGLNDLLTSAYYGTRGVVETLFYGEGNSASDEWTYGGGGTNIPLLTECRTADMISSSNISDFWNSLYTDINNLNYGLSIIDETAFSDEASRKRIKGELSFLRAWQYHLVVETWGSGAHFQTVPSEGVITEGHPGKIEDFYKLIISDLETAINNLPKQPLEKGRTSSYVAKGLKARVLISLAGYPDDIIAASGYTKAKLYAESKSLADDVIANSGKSLLSDYKSIFDVNNENNSEILWAVQFTSNLPYNTDGQHMHRYWVPMYNKSAHTSAVINKLPAHSIIYGREYRHFMPTKWLVQLYGPYDKRYDGSFQSVYLALKGEAQVPGDTALIRFPSKLSNDTYASYKKRGIPVDGIDDYYDPSTGVPTSNGRSYFIEFTKFLDPSRTTAKQEEGFKDIIIMRLAEMYLIGAECAYYQDNKQEAADYITKLRKRDLVVGHESSLAVRSADIDIDYILDERSRELAGEALRWFDLKRTHKLVERTKKYNPDALYISDIHNIRPIPVSELLKVTNPQVFKQNPGY